MLGAIPLVLPDVMKRHRKAIQEKVGLFISFSKKNLYNSKNTVSLNIINVL